MLNRTFAIGTAAQLILGRNAGGAVLQADAANTGDIYLGGDYVTADTTATGGVRLPAGGSVSVEIEGNDDLWAVAASGTQYLRVGQEGPR